MNPNPNPERRKQFFNAVHVEIAGVYGKHGDAPWGRREFYAILLEEVEELWDAIKQSQRQHIVEAELIQVAAMCLRYFETGDRYIK